MVRNQRWRACWNFAVPPATGSPGPGHAVVPVEDADARAGAPAREEPRPACRRAAVAADALAIQAGRSAKPSSERAPRRRERARTSSPRPSRARPRGTTAASARSPRTAHEPRPRSPRRPRRRRASPFSPSSDELRRLPDARRDERHAGRHRLEHALRAALLARRDDVDVERVVRPASPSRSGSSRARTRIAASLEPAPDVAAGRPGEEDDELGRPRPQTRSSAPTSTSGPLIELRLEPVAPADAVLLERADDERVARERRAPPAPRRAARRRRAGSARGRSRSGCGARGSASTPAASDELLASRACVTWTRSKRSGSRASASYARSNSG